MVYGVTRPQWVRNILHHFECESMSVEFFYDYAVKGQSELEPEKSTTKIYYI